MCPWRESPCRSKLRGGSNLIGTRVATITATPTFPGMSTLRMNVNLISLFQSYADLPQPPQPPSGAPVECVMFSTTPAGGYFYLDGAPTPIGLGPWASASGSTCQRPRLHHHGGSSDVPVVEHDWRHVFRGPVWEMDPAVVDCVRNRFESKWAGNLVAAENLHSTRF